MGLRTLEGVAMSELAPLAIDDAAIAALDGLAGVVDGRLIVAASGRPVLDRIVRELAHGA